MRNGHTLEKHTGLMARLYWLQLGQISSQERERLKCNERNQKKKSGFFTRISTHFTGVEAMRRKRERERKMSSKEKSRK